MVLIINPSVEQIVFGFVDKYSSFKIFRYLYLKLRDIIAKECYRSSVVNLLWILDIINDHCILILHHACYHTAPWKLLVILLISLTFLSFKINIINTIKLDVHNLFECFAVYFKMIQDFRSSSFKGNDIQSITPKTNKILTSDIPFKLFCFQDFGITFEPDYWLVLFNDLEQAFNAYISIIIIRQLKNFQDILFTLQHSQVLTIGWKFNLNFSGIWNRNLVYFFKWIALFLE